jgi:hypothetical protein
MSYSIGVNSARATVPRNYSTLSSDVQYPHLPSRPTAAAAVLGPYLNWTHLAHGAITCATKKAFEYMSARIRGLVGTWSGREASCARREVLLKSVAQVVSTYSMSCFLIPKDTCRKMKFVISNYWWGSLADSRHIHWQRWELLTRPKPLGRMGFRDLRLFNLAMLGKQGWRLMEHPDSLCARVLKG